MDNKYGLGSAKVAYAHHEATHKSSSAPAKACLYCGHDHLTLCPTLNDHYCEACGKYQDDVPEGYATGHIADY